MTNSVVEGLSFNKTFALKHIRSRLALTKPFAPLRAFVVRCHRPPYPTQLKAYSNMDGTAMLFLRDEPDELSLLGRFKVYHELGHIFFLGTRLDGESSAAPIRMLVTLAAVIPTTYLSGWTWLILAVYIAQQTFRERVMINRGLELQADYYAFAAFAELKTLPELLKKLNDYYIGEIRSLNSLMRHPRNWRSLFETSRLLHIFHWRQSLVQMIQRRLAGGKPFQFGRIVFDPADLVMSVIFGCVLARVAVLPGLWYLAFLAMLLLLVLVYAGHCWRQISNFQERIETFLPPRPS